MSQEQLIKILLVVPIVLVWAIMMFHQLRYHHFVANRAYRDWAASQPFRVIAKRVKLNGYLNPPGHFGDVPIGGYDVTFRIVVQDVKGGKRSGWLRLCEHDQRRRCSVLVSWDDLPDQVLLG